MGVYVKSDISNKNALHMSSKTFCKVSVLICLVYFMIQTEKSTDETECSQVKQMFPYFYSDVLDWKISRTSVCYDSKYTIEISEPLH